MKKYFVFLICFSLLLISCKNPASSPAVAGPTFVLVSPFSLIQWGTSGSGTGQFNCPEGLAVDSSGNVYVMDTNNGRVEKFDSNGNFLFQLGSPGTNPGQFHSLCGSQPNLEGVAVDLYGNIYVVDNGSVRIQKFDSKGNFQFWWGASGSGTGLNNPEGIVTDSSDNVYVADNGNSRIVKFTSNGSYLIQWGNTAGNGKLNGPTGVATDSLGDVYVTDNSNTCVIKYDSNGNYLLKWGSKGTNNGQFNNPSGITVDSWGNVYVGDSNPTSLTINNRIEKFDSNGNFILQWGNPGTGSGQLYNPEGVGVDSLGNVYVADTSNNNIQKTSYPIAFNGLATLGIFPNPDHSGQNENIAFNLSASLNFSIMIKDSLGNTVNQYQGQGVQGDNILQWNMTASNGNLIDPGAYFVTFQSGSTQATQTLTYVR
jgi:sugar lactone lactonase YvrE